MRMICSFFSIAIVSLCLLSLTGCSAPQLKIDLASTATLNLNQEEEPLPVVINIYQLKDKKTFEKASFIELWKSDLIVLKNSLLRKESLTLDPASEKKVIIEKNEDAKFVGIMAAFHQQTDDSWKVIKDVDRSFLWMDLSTTIKAMLKEQQIEIKE